MRTVWKCPDCGMLFALPEWDGLIPGFTRSQIACPRCPAPQGGGTPMIPTSRLARVWRRVTRCWILGHVEPRIGRRNPRRELYATNYCAHCGQLRDWPRPPVELMEFPESDLL